MSPRWGRARRERGLWFLLIVALIVGAPAPSARAAPAGGSSSPAAAVRRLVQGVAAAERSRVPFRRLSALCEQVIGPDVRDGYETQPVVIRESRSCGPALSVLVSYASDGARVPDYAFVRGSVLRARRLGHRQSVVDVRLRYLDQRGRAVLRRRARLLASRVDGGWWVATPEQLNPEQEALASVARLRRSYRAHRRAGAVRRRAHEAGLAAKRPFARDAACPTTGATQVVDPAGDVADQSANRTVQQPAGSDVVVLSSSPEGGTLCVEVTFAGQPASSGVLGLSVNEGEQTTVLFDAAGAVGQSSGRSSEPIVVAPSRGDRTLSFRLPLSELGPPTPDRPLEAELSTWMPNREDAFVDRAPDADGESSAG